MGNKQSTTDYFGNAENVSVAVEVSDSLVLEISLCVDDNSWFIVRSPGQVWKMHLELHLKHFASMMLDDDRRPDLHWYRFLIKKRKSITSEECNQFREYFQWILGQPELRASKTFCEFVEVSAISFKGARTKPIMEGFAKKRRGGRRFMLRGCSGAVGGVRSFFRPRFSKRWFALRPDFLLYTENWDSETVLDVILFDSEFVCERIPPSQGKVGTMAPSFLRSNSVNDSTYLKIQNGYRKIILNFESSERATEWMNAIKTAHAKSEYNCHHRFGSFAPPRDIATSHCQYLIDGEAYYTELSKAIKNAKKEIYITGWWLVNEVPLLRPGATESFLDLLKERACVGGVEVFIVLYKELAMALSLDSLRTTRSLEAASSNIKVILHPRQFGTRAVLAWSHHQKLVVVDQEIAFLGGLDICLGRFDNAAHRLIDNDSDQGNQMFPGQDYCNPCLRDCVDLTRPMADLMDRSRDPRLPWHDVHCKLEGVVVRDIARHFVQLWNHVKTDKHKTDASREVLTTGGVKRTSLKDKLKSLVARRRTQDGEPNDENEVVLHEDEDGIVEGGSADDVGIAAAIMLGRSISMVPSACSVDDDANQSRIRSQLSFDGFLGPPAVEEARTGRPSGGSVQFIRSGSWWSLGLPTDTSIMRAYIESIQSAENFIYIENQFFVTSSHQEGGHHVENLIGRAIAERILEAHSQGRRFKVYIVMPVMPAFENASLLHPNGFVTRITLQLQYQSLWRGKSSIVAFLDGNDRAKAEEIFHNHVVVCGLRQFDVWEKEGVVRTEQLYVHSKVMVVDDRIAIIGSANINDRSMLGDRDSEVAIHVEDPVFASQLRKDLWNEHWGGHCSSGIDDPSSQACFELWRKTANNNAEIYRDVFGVVPCDLVKNRRDFEERMELNSNRTVHKGCERLKSLNGRLVAFQFAFLEQEDRLHEPMPASASLCPREIFT